MKAVVTGIALLGSIAFAPSALAQTDLSSEQRQDAYDSVIRQRTPEPQRPPGFNNITPGSRVPDSAPSYQFPNEVKDEAIRRYEYMVIDNRLVLVDPKTRRIVDVVK
jgi:uncharacterized protein DUF1236